MFLINVTAMIVGGSSLLASPMVGDDGDRAMQVLMVVLTIVQILLGLGG